MSIASEITRIKDLREALAARMAALGIPNVSNTSTLSTCNTALAAVKNSTASATSLACGDSATIPAGYVKNKITITANSLSSQTSATATKSDILESKTAWVGGSKITGSMTNNGEGSTLLKLTSTTTSVDIAAGYWSSKNTVSVDTMGAPTVTLSNSSQKISCKDKMMTGNITIPAVNYYYTSTAAPSATSGYNDGDIWLVTAS